MAESNPEYGVHQDQITSCARWEYAVILFGRLATCRLVHAPEKLNIVQKRKLTSQEPPISLPINTVNIQGKTSIYTGVISLLSRNGRFLDSCEGMIKSHALFICGIFGLAIPAAGKNERWPVNNIFGKRLLPSMGGASCVEEENHGKNLWE